MVAILVQRSERKIKSWPARLRSGGDGGVALHLLVQFTTPLTKPPHHHGAQWDGDDGDGGDGGAGYCDCDGGGDGDGSGGGAALHLLVQSTTPLTKPLQHGEHLCHYHQISM